MPILGNTLYLTRCPLCAIAKPNLNKVHETPTVNSENKNRRFWRIYKCSTCGGLITAWAPAYDTDFKRLYPSSQTVDDSVPDKARMFLEQALESLHTPAGAVMLAASSVDAMLKAKDFKEGSLYERIDKAASEHTITDAMAAWAHDVRLDANDQRHADEEAPLPEPKDANRAVDFALALSEYMFALPGRVRRGLESAQPDGDPE